MPGTPQTFAAFCLCLGTVSFSGCSHSGVETVPVIGVVTFDGNPPPGPGVIFFQPTENPPGHPERPATASFDKTGQFAARSFQPGDGLVPGTYQVSLHCWEVPPNLDGRPPKSFIPMRYLTSNASGLKLQVPSGSSRIRWPIELESQ